MPKSLQVAMVRRGNLSHRPKSLTCAQKDHASQSRRHQEVTTAEDVEEKS